MSRSSAAGGISPASSTATACDPRRSRKLSWRCRRRPRVRRARRSPTAAAPACRARPFLASESCLPAASSARRSGTSTSWICWAASRFASKRTEFTRTIGGRSILITGAAGSIGSELCRQTARFQPARLVLFDQAESPLYNIDLEMRAKFPSMEIVAELGDVRDPTVVDDLIRRHHVDSIFHAAAYKHVPMMEAHVAEAVKTNIFGTWNVVRAAYRNHVSNFLMISTDKAVNPSSVMGLTKRIAELIAHAQDLRRQQLGHAFFVGAVWKRPREQWQRRAAVPGADRRRRSRHRHPSRDAPLLHEHPRSSGARAPGVDDVQGLRDIRPRHGRAGPDHGPCRRT